VGWLVGWLEFNVPFQHKYGYIRDETVVVGLNVFPKGDASVTIRTESRPARIRTWQKMKSWMLSQRFTTSFDIAVVAARSPGRRCRPAFGVSSFACDCLRLIINL